jgi:hypothetical protein
MSRLPGWLESYRTLPGPVLLFAAAQFLINLINSAHFLLLNLFLKDQGMSDPVIAALTSQRFVATFFLALPAGLWLRGRPLRKPMLIGTLLFPLTALASLETVRLGMMGAASWCFLAMGFAGLVLNVAGLPMMMRLAPPKKSSEALSLLFATWAAASVCAGLLSTVLQRIGQIDIGGLRFQPLEYGFFHKRLEGRALAGKSAAHPEISHGQSFLKYPSHRLRFEDRGKCDHHPRGCRHQLDAEKLALADADGPRVLRDRDDGDGVFAL